MGYVQYRFEEGIHAGRIPGSFDLVRISPASAVALLSR